MFEIDSVESEGAGLTRTTTTTFCPPPPLLVDESFVLNAGECRLMDGVEEVDFLIGVEGAARELFEDEDEDLDDDLFFDGD